MTQWDAVIVGAGPAGAATACHLAGAGARVLVIDRTSFPRHKPCSEYLSPEATRLLERLGGDVLGAVERAAPARLYGMKVIAPNGGEMCGRFAADHGYPSPRPYSFALPRITFDLILRQAAERAGAVVWEDAAVEELHSERGAIDGVRVRTRGGKRDVVDARVVVAADGLHSLVARRLRLARRSAPTRIAFTAHVADVAGLDGMGELHVGDCGYVGMGPIGADVTDRCTRPAARGPAPPPARCAGQLLHRAGAVPGAARTVRSAAAGARGTGDGSVRTLVPPLRWRTRVGRCWSATPPTSSIRSPARGSTARCAARSWPRVSWSPRSQRNAPLTRAVLAPYGAARRAAFGGKWVLERLICLGVGWPALTNRVVSRLARRPHLADLVVGATGNFVPAGRVLSPGVLAQLLW